MSTEIRKLLIMNTLSSVIAIYIGIFVNLYIWEQGQHVSEVSLYNMSMFVCWGIAFIAAAKLLTRYSIRLPLAVSAVCGAAAFLYLMYVHIDNRMLWIILLGVPVGFMFGLAQAVQSLSVALQAKSSEFAPYFAYISVTFQVLSMAVPFAAATVIDGFGYGGSFWLMLLFVALMLVFSAYMPRITLPSPIDAEDKHEHGRFRFRTAFGQPGSISMLFSLLAGGVFLQFQNLFTLLFTFSVTQDKLLIALLNMLYTLCAIIGFWMFRRVKISESRWFWLGTLLLAAGFLIVLLRVPAALITSNLLTAVGMIFFTTVWNTQQFRFIQHLGAVRQTSFLVWRECLLVATRCLLLSLTLSLTEFAGRWFVFIITVTLACLFSIPIAQHRALRIKGEKPLEQLSL
ncbi:MFS transporter [Cohnella kolymensis]|uniref:MFS transporter n=1 Tax=Cohnella kolymensis TaxID=1590652 RepID=UPI000697A7A7|nr:MFS transporter [Cohnella kolymensis]